MNSFRRAPVDFPRCPLPCFKLPEKFPFELALLRARAGADIGSTGIFNQFEFLSILLDISKLNVACWVVRSLECVQQSLALHTVLAIAHEHGCPKAPAKSSDSKADDPWSFFDSSLLGVEKASRLQHKSVQSDPDPENLSEFDFAEGDDDLLEFFMDTKDQDPDRKIIPKDELAKASDSAGEANKKAPSDAGSIRSHHSAHSHGHVKTVATEAALVKEALEEIGRRASTKTPLWPFNHNPFQHIPQSKVAN